MRQKRRNQAKIPLNGNSAGSVHKTHNTKRKKTEKVGANKTHGENDPNRKLDILFYGSKNIYLRDIHNFIINLRIEKNLYRNDLFIVKNSDCINNLIVVVVPNLSSWFIRDISTNGVFSKLQKNNNFRKINTENCFKNNYSNLILKALSVSVMKKNRGTNYNSSGDTFYIENYLLSSEQMLLNRYPKKDSEDYLSFDNIEYIKVDKGITDMRSYLNTTMNTTSSILPDHNGTPNELKHSDEANIPVAEPVDAPPNGNDPNGDTTNLEKTTEEAKNIFTEEHITMYAQVLEKLLRASEMASQKKGKCTPPSDPKEKEKTESIEEFDEEENQNHQVVNGGEEENQNHEIVNGREGENQNHQVVNGGEEEDQNYQVVNGGKEENADGGTHACPPNGEVSGGLNSLSEDASENGNTNNGRDDLSYSNTPKWQPPVKFDLDNIYSIDCEMCETINKKRELTKITVVDAYMNIVYDSYVIPDNQITNYLTPYSGISESTLQNVHTKLKDVQEHLKKFFNKESILIGHSLENDLHALQIHHEYVIDTSVIYSNSAYCFLKPSLFNLCQRYLGITMKREKGHNSIDDAKISMFLALKKMSEFDTAEPFYQYQPLPAFLNRDNFTNVKGNVIYQEDLSHKYEKNLCIYDAKNEYIEEKLPRYFLKNSFHCPCENDDECVENLIMNIKNENKIKNYLLILREYENLCNRKIYNCVKNAKEENFKVDENGELFQIPTRVEASEILKKLSQNIESIYENLGANDVLILLSFNSNYLAEEKITETLFLAKDIFYANIETNDKLSNLTAKINSMEKIIAKKQSDNDLVNLHFLQFRHLLSLYERHIITYLNEQKNNDRNIFILNSLTNLKNIVCGNSRKKTFNGWFSILLKA
ncbi:exonuclease, putative [Plasmodium knowlesi strain H]|uniref:Exonuclease, putative n=3 Tax=Plasmodium knowlesi TaxID=5850 RepID=A0A5K1UBL9_PLAKH|nr:exonuclease, putative [Plasmodium knowlesi strain H]OTN66187.1 putative Exonuclease [Plasmodium knowlesi]CAA9989959.1 exonuclease, putative [Plasmodium knowlesi strain H]SBO24541.1 exonuclease, putative [Plasmodium knowlesi strain H]SBO26380.1 exonuclease, putative [Plasmodium knowlesi strain H]VVS79433.1 exonuclease, putative [Plasmodium knowlesi strain H]|eukprot:XP_002259974.1 Exonuclease, putative [Plasmodium knowlesi strain H]